jgi:hypothetical protein
MSYLALWRKHGAVRVGDAVRCVAIRADGSGPGRMMAAATLALLREHGAVRVGITGRSE